MITMRAKVVGLTVILAICGFGRPSHGQLLIDPIGKADPGKVEGMAGAGLFEADYEGNFNRTSTDGEIKRRYLFGGLALGVNDVVDLVLCGAFILQSEIEFFDHDDSGFIVGGGLRSRVWQRGSSALHAYGQVSYVDEDYGREPILGELANIEESTTGVEVLIGALYATSFDALTLYGGVEIVPYSDGELDIRVSGAGAADFFDETATIDLEREEIVSIKLGGEVQLGSVRLQADATLIGEQTIRVAAVAPF